MSWSRFKFYTSEMSRLLKQGKGAADAYLDAQNSTLSKEFGPELKPNKLQSKIIGELKQSKLPSDQAVRALEIYKALNLTDLAQKPNRLRRVGIYIGYLTFAYCAMSAVYFSSVFPNISAIFDEVDIPASDRYLWFADNWGIIVAVVLCLLLLAFSISKKISDLFEFKSGVEQSFLYRALLPKKIKTEYEYLLSLIWLPLDIAKESSVTQSAHLIKPYSDAKYSNTEIAESVSILLSEKLSSLISRSESYMRKIYVVIAVLVVASIYEFVGSIYTPLFSMGKIA